MQGLNDDAFNTLLQAWPKKAIEYLYDHYYHGLVRIAERRTHDRKASEDIAQEALIEIWKKSAWITRRKHFLVGPYLIHIVKRKSYTFYRRGLRENKEPNPVLDQQASLHRSIEAELIQSGRYLHLRGIVSTLPSRERECIQMRFFQERSIGAIAGELGLSIKSVEKYITRALKRLRNHRSTMY